jgi:hypothetical protein
MFFAMQIEIISFNNIEALGSIFNVSTGFTNADVSFVIVAPVFERKPL